jgi:DNA-directed RNA polymerase specialized sigma subunit, sigma24 homolog
MLNDKERMSNHYKLINELYNFAYLCIGRKYAEKIIIRAFIKFHKKIENNNLELIILKYIYKTDGSAIMNILSKQAYDPRCALLLRYNTMYSYDDISKIMNLSIKGIKYILKNALHTH